MVFSPFLFNLVPPEIEPFSFGDLSLGGAGADLAGTVRYGTALAGTRTRVICGLSRGDLPVTFQWLKDGHPLHHHHSQLLLPKEPSTFAESYSNQLDPTISSVDLFSSLLTISRLSPEHTGNYTCLAINPAGSSRYTATLKVKGENIRNKHFHSKFHFLFLNRQILDSELLKLSCNLTLPL